VHNADLAEEDLMLRRVAALAVSLALSSAAFAGATDPIALEVPDDTLGPKFPTGFRSIAAFPVPYVEEEWFASGAATLFTYNDPPVPSEIVPVQTGQPYKTRFVVRRPANAADFNGTVVIEWLNSTAGFDTAPSWDASAEYFGRKGIVYVGVTNSDVAIRFMRGGCRLFGLLPPSCGTRYRTLSLPENGLAYEMLSQLAHALKSGANTPLPAGFEVKRLFHVGQSQQGGSVITYASAFHFPDNDGYFIQAAFSARPINSGVACGSAGAPAYPACTPRLTGPDLRVRTDLPVPVIRAQTETDMGSVASGFGVLAFGARQTDTDDFRYYETAGTGHNVVHENIDVAGTGYTLDDFCLSPINSFADGPVFGAYLYNAMWEALEQRHDHGTPLPVADKPRESNGDLVRDAYGTAVGGLRLPELDVPVATYAPNNTMDPALPAFLQPVGALVCRLSGAVTPFSQAQLRTLYPTHGRLWRPYLRRLNGLIERRLLLPEDADKLRARIPATVSGWLN
jgi:hypothetical protein